MGDDYTEPRGLVPVLQIVKGELRLKDPSQPLPTMDSPAVELRWPASPIELVPGSGPVLELKMPSNITVERLPPNTVLEINGTGLRASAITSMKTPEVEMVSPEAAVPGADEPDASP